MDAEDVDLQHTAIREAQEVRRRHNIGIYVEIDGKCQTEYAEGIELAHYMYIL